MDESAMVQLKSVWKTYPRGEIVVEALKDISINIRKGEFLVVLGPSGSGKTTLLNLIDVKRSLDSMLQVLTVEVKERSLEVWQEMMDLFYGFMFVMFSFGALLAAAVIFNTATVNITERRRELATMRTMGITTGEIAKQFTVENLTLGAVGIVTGSLLGTWLALRFSEAYSGEFFDFTMVIEPRSYILTGLGTLAIAFISQLPGLLRIKRMNLADQVRERVA